MSRFPLTAAAIEHELEGFAEALLTSPAFIAKVEALFGVKPGTSAAPAASTGNVDMATVKELQDALASTRSSVDSLTGKIGQGNTGIDPADLDPVLKEVSDLRSTVEALSKSLDKPEGAAADPVVQTGEGATAAGQVQTPAGTAGA
jgi:hypothetical protein